MMHSIAKVIIVALAVVLASRLVPGIAVESFMIAVLVALVLGVINLTIRPVLGILTLPITILTLGLFSFILNALLFWGTALVIPGFDVNGFIPALLGSLIVATAYYVADAVLS